MLVKAVPQVGSKHGETVCCAGVTLEGQWRRMYPIRFRRLSDDSKFNRWHLVGYDAHLPRDDRRLESRRVHEESLQVGTKLSEAKRADFLDKIIRPSVKDAAGRGETLAIVRPKSFHFRIKPMEPLLHQSLKRTYAEAAKQQSFLDRELVAFDPPRFHFLVSYEDSEGGRHHHQCGDWETIATFTKWSRLYGEQSAIDRLTKRYNDFHQRGIVLALGTVKKRPKQWIMLGIIRADQPTGQLAFI